MELSSQRRLLIKLTDPTPSAKRSIFEQLEPRLLLSGTAEQQAIEMFSVSTALFVENQGQWADESIRYVHNGSGANVAMTDQGVLFDLFRREPTDIDTDALSDDLAPDAYETYSIQFSASFDGANIVTPVGLDQSGSVFNYQIGDQANWREGVASYEIIAYEGLYDGIDLQTWGQRDSLKYEFHVAPGADFSQILVSYEGIESLSINQDGSLAVALGGEWGNLVDDTPYIYQVIDGQQVEVAGRFELVDSDTYTFEITGEYDATQELIIDPDLAWSSYIGGSGYEEGYGIAVDSSGNVLVTGYTDSVGWVSGGWGTSFNGYCDAYVTKLSPDGEHLWSSYIGGDDEDYAKGIAADSSGNVLVTGTTYSAGWVSGGWDTSYNNDYDAFVVKLSSDGGHLWSSYIGGDSSDYGRGIAVDSSDNVLVTGDTGSPDWVSGGWDTSHNGSGDAFVAKLSPVAGISGVATLVAATWTTASASPQILPATYW